MVQRAGEGMLFNRMKSLINMAVSSLGSVQYMLFLTLSVKTAPAHWCYVHFQNCLSLWKLHLICLYDFAPVCFTPLLVVVLKPGGQDTSSFRGWTMDILSGSAVILISWLELAELHFKEWNQFLYLVGSQCGVGDSDGLRLWETRFNSPLSHGSEPTHCGSRTGKTTP